MSFSLFCRKSVQSWMRRFWVKKCRRDHLWRWWRSVVLVTVHRWQRREAAEGYGEVWPSVGLRSLWWSVVATTVRPAGSSWSSEKWSSTQIPRVEVFWNEDPRRTVVPITVRHIFRRWEWREQQNKLHKYGTTESTMVRHDHDGLSSVWRAILQVRHEVQRSNPSTHIPRV